MKFTDSHCHLDFPEFSANIPELIQQCAQANIHQIIIPAIHPDNWQKVIALTSKHRSSTPLKANQAKANQQHCKLYPCLGIHPWFLNKLNSSHLELLRQQVNQNKDQLVAIGEAGIDGTVAKQQDNLNKQQYFFDEQLQLAKEVNLPIIIHHRQSHQFIVPLLKQHKLSTGGIVHAFSGSYQQAKDYIDLGFKLGVGGTITYSRAKKTINAIKRLPIESLVLETDAPAMPLADEQGKINSPLNIVKIFKQLLLIRDESETVLAEQLELTVKNVFFNKNGD
jgi:TatD DNase family protein